MTFPEPNCGVPPTAQTLFASTPQIAKRSFVVPEVCADHAVPFHFKMVPPLPTAHTLVALVPHTPSKFAVVPEVCADHAVPLYFKIVPVLPTAHTLLESAPQTSRKCCVVPDVWGAQSKRAACELVTKSANAKRRLERPNKDDIRNLIAWKSVII